MAFFFPWIEKDINWDKGYEFLDKEFQAIVKEAETGRRYVDKLIRVWRKDDVETWLLIHIEVQGEREICFPERMYVYNYRGYDRYRKPVVRARSKITSHFDEPMHPAWLRCSLVK